MKKNTKSMIFFLLFAMFLILSRLYFAIYQINGVHPENPSNNIHWLIISIIFGFVSFISLSFAFGPGLIFIFLSGILILPAYNLWFVGDIVAIAGSITIVIIALLCFGYGVWQFFVYIGEGSKSKEHIPIVLKNIPPRKGDRPTPRK